MNAKLEEGNRGVVSSEGATIDKVRPKRESHALIMNILEVARRGARKTKIIDSVGLSWAQSKKYLSKLKQRGFLSEESGVWKTTEKGLYVIEACRLCQSLME